MTLEIHNLSDELQPGAKSRAELRVTDIRAAVRDENRVNIYINDKFFCSLDISQVVDYHVKIGRVLSEGELADLKRASDFGKFYAQALGYALLRPRSSKEMMDYLKKKTLNRKIRIKNKKTGEYQTKEKTGYDASLVPLVFGRLEERGYIDDRRFAELWSENRNTKKGISEKKLRLELRQKGISEQIIDEIIASSSRSDRDELRKVIAKKAKRYPDQQKLIQYLLRQGFNYSDISDELSIVSSSL